MIANSVGEFDGSMNSNVDSWITATHALVFQLSDFERFLVLSRALKGPALHWFHNMQAHDARVGRMASWDEWMHRLHAQYRQLTSSRLRELESRFQRPDESAAEFAAALELMLRAYDPNVSDREMVQFLRTQMHPKYREAFAMRCMDPANLTWRSAVDIFSAAAAHVQEFASPVNSSTHTTPTRGASGTTPTSYSLVSQSPKKTPCAGKAKPVDPAAHALANISHHLKSLSLAQDFRREDRQERQSLGRSGRTDGSSTDSNSSDSDSGEDEDPRERRQDDRCFNCQGFGHKSYVCPSKPDLRARSSSRKYKSGH